MDMDIKENETVKEITLTAALVSYKDVTIELMDALEKEEYDSLDTLLLEREDLIDSMNTLNYSEEEFKKQCTELEILEFQQKVENKLQEKQRFITRELQKISSNKTANKNYKKGFTVDSIFFNKKI